jgi:NAD(P)-dependent dehydrogenase (short-subunit alcohol dehydrogenase family)
MIDKILNIVIIGASGSIGSAFVREFIKIDNTKIYALSRSEINFKNPKVTHYHIDIEDEQTIIKAANFIMEEVSSIDTIILATGALCIGKITPEKSLKQLSINNFKKLFAINTIGPAMVAKYFVPKLNKNSRTIFAAISARVGSITDNKKGGWYSYRASKAALNMIIKNLSIETSRTKPSSIVTILHPGTVDSRLSAPFHNNVRPETILSPEESVVKMLEVIDSLTPEDSGKFFSWNGKQIEF